MADDRKKDRELIENLDRMLAGRDEEIAGPLDDDTRTALDFARKMASLGEKPSEEYTENLKAQLIHRLAEQQKEDSPENRTLLFWGMPRRRLWQGTIAAVILVIVAAVILLIVLLLNSPG